MKFQFYLLPLLLFLFSRSAAQDCSTLSVSYTTTESRCVATGSIDVTVAGGSGNYTYKAVGPITTPVTSINTITGLPRGYYSIIVKDLATGCSKQVDSAFIPGNYSDPRFQLTKTDASCIGNDGSVSVINEQNGRGPFSYSIIAPSPAQVGTTTTTGSFTGLIPGEYYIQLKDSCGGIQVRTITIANYNWWINALTVVQIDCNNVNVSIELKDNMGNVNTSGTAFNGFTYGYVLNGDTTWYSQNNFSVFIGSHKNLMVVVKDNCGHIISSVWYFPDNIKPTANNVAISNLTCSTFTATASGQNLTTPQYCLYDNVYMQLSCNTTGIFNNLAYGSYCIEITNSCYDTVIVKCFTVTQPIPSVNASVNITNKNCSSFTATITGQQNLFTPNYCLYDTANVQISCNSTGIFNNIPYGSYCIKTHDACTDSIITRCFTVTKPVPTLTSYTITNGSCTSFTVGVSGTGLNLPYYCLYDSLGNVVACDSTGIFSGIGNGHYCIRAVSCGDSTNIICFTGSAPIPSVGPGVSITNKKCAVFTASMQGQANLVNPNYCLYDANDSLLTCNTTGIFVDIAYGSYCIKVHDGCVDTTITRCFTQLRSTPSIDAAIQLLSATCSTVSFQVNGTNLTNPVYYLYDSVGMVIDSNLTGLFNNYPFARYCVTVHDGCYDTSMTVCKTFIPLKGISLATSKSCTIGNANVDVTFANSNSPYIIKIYHPNGSLLIDTTVTVNPFHIQLSALPLGTRYKIVGTDQCGYKDSAYITPDANIVTRSVSVRAKCPSALWLNGAGDINASCTSNSYTVVPQIIKKNGVVFIASYTSVTSNVYTFSDLEPAQYVLEYTQGTCNGKVYDTITVPPYTYPSQGQSAIYQCDNNSFSLGADVVGGVSPYTFQIIGSLPSSPSIVSTPQNSPVFTINNGTVYSLVRLRTIDACGNATLSDVSVLPLQNISISASGICFYQDILLTVDTIPNATYLWYKKTSPTDSVLLDSGLTYDLPFFVPEQIGQYICKVIVNDGCVTRLSYFDLDGNCGEQVLPVGFNLNGRRRGNANELYWKNTDERMISKYVVERKRSTDENFIAIGSVNIHGGGSYLFNDNDPGSGANLYRLRLIYPSKTEFSNTINLSVNDKEVLIYPNPVKDMMNISLSSGRATNYKIELVTSNGQVMYVTEVKNITSSTIHYPRNKSMKPGIYLLRITDTDANTTEIRKLLFE